MQNCSVSTIMLTHTAASLEIHVRTSQYMHQKHSFRYRWHFSPFATISIFYIAWVLKEFLNDSWCYSIFLLPMASMRLLWQFCLARMNWTNQNGHYLKKTSVSSSTDQLFHCIYIIVSSGAHRNVPICIKWSNCSGQVNTDMSLLAPSLEERGRQWSWKPSDELNLDT